MNKRLSIRTGGMALYISGSALIIFIAALIVTIFAAVQDQNIFLLIASIPLYGYLIFYFQNYMRGNCIILTDNYLFYKKWRYGLHPGNSLLPKTITKKIKLDKIEVIILGRAEYFDEKFQSGKEDALKTEIENLKKIHFKSRIPISIWVAAKYTPLMYILEKNEKTHLISTKPFSKRSFKHLFNEFKRIGLDTEIQDNLL